jgi:hypothetical protein
MGHVFFFSHFHTGTRRLYNGTVYDFGTHIGKDEVISFFNAFVRSSMLPVETTRSCPPDSPWMAYRDLAKLPHITPSSMAELGKLYREFLPLYYTRRASLYK